MVEAYNRLEAQVNLLPQEIEVLPMREIEKRLFLYVIDTLWIEHLETMDYMRTGIGLRGYGQRDPLVEYKKESLRMFRELLGLIDRQVAVSIFRIGFVKPQELKAEDHSKNLKLQGASDQSSLKSPMTGDSGLEDRQVDQILKDDSHYNGQKVGRNDPCPCGATYPDGTCKKYKDCHGK